MISNTITKLISKHPVDDTNAIDDFAGVDGIAVGIRRAGAWIGGIDGLP